MMTNPKPDPKALRAAEAAMPVVTMLRNGWTVRYPRTGGLCFTPPREPKDRPMPWCDACHSYHIKPRTRAEHSALKCFAPWRGKKRS